MSAVVSQIRPAEHHQPDPTRHYIRERSECGKGAVVAVCACGWACLAEDEDARTGDDYAALVELVYAAVWAHGSSYGGRDGSSELTIRLEPFVPGWERGEGRSTMYAWTWHQMEHALERRGREAAALFAITGMAYQRAELVPWKEAGR